MNHGNVVAGETVVIQAMMNTYKDCIIIDSFDIAAELIGDVYSVFALDIIC